MNLCTTFKNWLPLLKVVLLWLVLSSPNWVQANTTNTEEITKQLHPLAEVLEELGNKYRVFFSYKKNTVSGVNVHYEHLEGETIEAALNRVLINTGFAYESFNKKYFVIFKKSRKGVRDAKKLKRSLKKLQKLEEKGNVKMQSSTWSNAAKLKSTTEYLAKKLLEKTLRGTIKDETGQVLIGASVQVKNTSIGTISDLDGNFEIEVPDDATTLVFSYTGYEVQEVEINGQTFFDIILLEGIQLDEVVVVGYGTQKKSDVTGALSSIGGEDINDTKEANALMAISGKVAGVDVSLNSAQPGVSPNILIRGRSSLNFSNQPLIVVDGIPIEGGLQDISTEDIKSMDVLKDASSTAIYGARGANGVILITTKRGTTGRAIFSYDTYVGFSEPVSLRTMQSADEYVNHLRQSRRRDLEIAEWTSQGLSQEQWPATGSAISLDQVSIEDALTQEQLSAYNAGIDNDFQDFVFRDNSFQHNHRLGVTGGTEKVRYAISMNYLSQEGIIHGNDYDRYTLRSNLDIDITERLSLAISQQFSYSLLDNVGDGETFYQVYSSSPLVQAYGEGGIPTLNPLGVGTYRNPINDVYNNQFIDEHKTFRYFGNISASYKFTDDLKYILNVGPEISSLTRNVFKSANSTSRASSGTSFGSKESTLRPSFTIENILKYNKRFADVHNIDATLLFSVQDNNVDYNFASGQDFASETQTFNSLGQGSGDPRVGSSLTKERWESYMLRVNYDFKNKYLLTLTGRYDGSSKLSEGNKYEFFPSGSLAWKISEEDFLKDDATIDNLKLRVGYGRVGRNPIAPYATFGSLQRVEGSFADQQGSGFRPLDLPNQELRWEINTTSNVGLDFALLDYKITGSIDFYQGNTTDLLLFRVIPITTGHERVLENIGETKNSGIEVTLGANLIRTNDFSWSLDANFSRNRNEIVQLATRDDDIGNSWFIGEPLSVFYDYQYDGVWRLNDFNSDNIIGGFRPGDARYVDINSDGVIEAGNDRTIVGQRDPKWLGGLTSKMNYKGFDFTVVAFARQGHVVRHDLRIQPGNEDRSALSADYWSPENDGGEFPRSNRHRAASRIVDASSVRIRNITLGYNFQPEIAHKFFGASRIRLYANLQNPFLFSAFDFDGFDPDTAGSGNPLQSLKSYIFGLNVSF